MLQPILCTAETCVSCPLLQNLPDQGRNVDLHYLCVWKQQPFWKNTTHTHTHSLVFLEAGWPNSGCIYISLTDRSGSCILSVALQSPHRASNMQAFIKLTASFKCWPCILPRIGQRIWDRNWGWPTRTHARPYSARAGADRGQTRCDARTHAALYKQDCRSWCSFKAVFSKSEHVTLKRNAWNSPKGIVWWVYAPHSAAAKSLKM